MIEPYGDVTKLSKWAQRYIGELNDRISALESSLKAASHEHPGSNVVLRGYNHTDPDVTLPPDSIVYFYVGEGNRNRLTNMVEIHHDHQNPDRLRIASYGSRGVRLVLSSSNSFYLELEKR